MRIKQKLAAMLAVLLILIQGLPVLASPLSQEEPETTTIEEDSGILPLPEVSQPSDMQEPSDVQPPVAIQPPATIQPPDIQPPEPPILETVDESENLIFSANLLDNAEVPGVYGTLNYIPEDTRQITVLYSFDSEDFHTTINSDEDGDRKWDLSGFLEEGRSPELTQLCVGINDYPLKAYQSLEENNLYIKLEIEKDSGSIQTEAIKLSYDEALSIPVIPPEFFANIELTFEGYVLRGTFTDFLPDTSVVRPMYSLDGQIYEPIGGDLDPMDWDLSGLGTDDPEERSFLQNQICAYATDEPMNSYLKQGLKRFYVKLQITTKSGDIYYTQEAVIDRGTPQLPPENVTVSANFTSTMIVVDKTQRPPTPYGKYQITVREDASVEDVYALLPDMLPIEVRILQKDTNRVITSGIVNCDVTWKDLPDLKLTAGEAFTIKDAAKELIVPEGMEVSTPLGIYQLPDPIALETAYESDEVRIVVNVIEKEEKPDVSLAGSRNDDWGSSFDPLSLAFSLKPSGATAIKAYSYVEGDEDWIEICDLLSRRDVDANQSAQLYGFVDVLQPDELFYADYLKGETPGFLIGIIIEGGTFDGESVMLPWPGEYTPPTRIPELDGSGGNENNAGSGDGSGNSTEGGQRPNLPEEVIPPVTIPPLDTSDFLDDNETSTISSTPPGTQEDEGSSVSTNQQSNADTTVQTEESDKDKESSALPIVIQVPKIERQAMGGQGSSIGVQNVPDNKEYSMSSPRKSKPDKEARLSKGNEEQFKEKSNGQTATRKVSKLERTKGLLGVAVVIFLGSGITVAAVVGVGTGASGITGTGGAAKLFTALKNFLKHIL